MPAQPELSAILSFEDALQVVEEHAAKLAAGGQELVALIESYGRALAEPISADRNFPPFPRAARDGYAVIAADLSKLPATLKVVAEIRAGAKPESLPSLVSGQAAAIMTGAPAPPGADAVVMVEHTSTQGDSVQVHHGLSGGNNIVPVGSEARRNERLLDPGMRLDQAAIAVAASVGRARLLLYKKPRSAVLAT